MFTTRIPRFTIGRKWAVLFCGLTVLACGGRDGGGPYMEPELAVRLSASICSESPCMEEPVLATPVNVNGDFELAGPQGPNGPPLGWSVLSGSWGFDIREAIAPIEGRRSIELPQPTYATVELASRRFDVTGAVGASASAVVRWPSSDQSGSLLHIGIRWFDGDGRELAIASEIVSAAIGQRRYDVVGARPSFASTAEVFFIRFGIGYAGPVIDNVTASRLE